MAIIISENKKKYFIPSERMFKNLSKNGFQKFKMFNGAYELFIPATYETS